MSVHQETLPTGQDLTVLIIDDDPDFCRLLVAYLSKAWPAARIDVRDPTRESEPKPPPSGSVYDVVLLDYCLGTENGLDWLRTVRRASHPPAVILVTGAGDEELAVQALKAGAEDYLPKQRLTGQRLIQSVAEVLRRRADDCDATTAHHPVYPAIPGYRVVRRLAHRDASTVFLVERSSDGQLMVVKTWSRNASRDSSGTERFLAEYGWLSRLDHPHVARCFDFGTSPAHLYFAMEYLPGGTLQERIRHGFPRLETIQLIDVIASALEVVHAAGIVHRDLKPSNILFDAHGQAKLIDFGIAHPQGTVSDLAHTGHVMGTSYYMSPEQAQGQGIDGRSDLYSLGVVLYELLAGQRPYAGDDPVDVLHRHVYAPVPRLPFPDPELQPILDRLLAKHPAERYPHAVALRHALPRPAPTSDPGR